MKLLLLFYLLLCFNNAFCNENIEGELFGMSDVKQVEITPPIGGYSNYFYKKYCTVSHNKFSFDLSVTNPVFLQLRVGYKRIFLIVSPGDNTKIKIFNTPDRYKSLRFEGNNAAGQYWYNIYNNNPLDNMIGHGVLFDALTAKSKDETLKKLGRFFGEQTHPLEVLFEQKQIDSEFFSLIRTDIRAKHALNMIDRLTSLQDKTSDKRTNNKYQVLIDALKKFGGPNKVENTRCGFGVGFLMSYYSIPKSGVSENSASVWGVYRRYATAPSPIRVFLLGDILVFSKVIGTSEFPYSKALNIYINEFPKSPYVNFLNSLKPVEQNVGEAPNVVLDTALTFHTFEQLKQHFKGKSVYIDLWATWCMPCRAEFPSYQRIKPTLKLKNITSLFISIDAPSEKEMWQTVINQDHLAGHHILVNKALMADIIKVIYKNGYVSIPRYILINKQGAVVNWNAPRPSDPELFKVFSEL